MADELRERLSALSAGEAMPANASLADLAVQRANATLAAQKAHREAQAAKEEEDQREAAREIEEGIKAMELQRRALFGTSPGDKSGPVGDAKSRLAVPSTEYTMPRSDESGDVEHFNETIELGGRAFSAVKVSCPQPSMFLCGYRNMRSDVYPYSWCNWYYLLCGANIL